jgi:transposase
MREARLNFCLAHQHWDLEDWKNVIWTDETSVVLGTRRGMRTRVWRKSYKAFEGSNSKVRYKKYSEFMFWGCFSYDKKGPMHIWKKETAAEKKEAKAFIDKLNAALEPLAKAKWEREQARKRALRRRGGRRAVWKFDKRHGAIDRGGRGGIDWYRYQTNILLPKLFPFARKCREIRPNTVVIEDGAPSHISKNQARAWLNSGVVRSFWPGNSPDLNMIEPCWGWMKRMTTRKGAPGDRKTAEKVWSKCWKRLPQAQIQQWIERIPRHIKEVIELEGDNLYREGKEDGLVRPYNSTDRKNRYQSHLQGQFREDLRLTSDSPNEPSTPAESIDLSAVQADMLANIASFVPSTPPANDNPDNGDDEENDDSSEDDSSVEGDEEILELSAPVVRPRNVRQTRQQQQETATREPGEAAEEDIPPRSRYGRALRPTARRAAGNY